MGCDISTLTNRIAKGKKGYIQDEQGKQYIDKKLLLLGLDHAGKTTLLLQFKENQFSATVPTIGLNVEQIPYQNIMFTMWDVGGQATKLWKHYFEQIDGILFVIDCLDAYEYLQETNDKQKQKFNENRIKKFKKAKQEFEKVIKEPSLELVPISIVLNKFDLLQEKLIGKKEEITQNPYGDKLDRILDEETELKKQQFEKEVLEQFKFIKKEDEDVRTCIIKCCSAKTGEGIFEVLQEISYLLTNHQEINLESQQSPSKKQKIEQELKNDKNQKDMGSMGGTTKDNSQSITK